MVVDSKSVESSPVISDHTSLVTLSSDHALLHPNIEIHRVGLPPKRSTFHKLKYKLSEIFFSDDPLHRFKNQSFLRKWILGFQYVLPILQWLPSYSLEHLRSDLIAGLTIASLSIPQGISYAKLAYLPPVIGLYSSFVPPLIYTALGSSRQLGVGPVSIASLVMGSMLSETVPPTDQPLLYLHLALTATFFAGLFETCLGLFRLGFLIDYLSKATLIGFMAGAAVIVSMQQLKGLLGIVHFAGKTQIIPVVSSVFHERREWSWQTIVMGFSFLLFLLTARLIGLKKPKLFWISAAAPLTSVVLSTLFVFILKSNVSEISQIGTLPRGLNPSTINNLYFHGPHLGLAIKTGLITGILSLTEGIAVGRTFSTLQNYQIDGNKEMIAIGLMNMAGSCSSCYITTGSFSRTAVNYNAGAKTAMSNVVMSSAVLVALLYLMPLFYYTPNVVLAAIIITAVIGLIDYNAAMRLYKIDKLDFLACLCSFFGVLFLSVQMGLTIAVGVSVFKILLQVTRPNTNIMGNIPGTQLYQCLSHYEKAQRVPSFLILGIGSPIYFANSAYLQERILRWVSEEEERIQSKITTTLRCIILDMTGSGLVIYISLVLHKQISSSDTKIAKRHYRNISAVTAIDTSGIDALRELKTTLNKRSLQLVLVNPAGDVVEKLNKSEVLDEFRTNGLYLTVGEAIADISITWKP